MASSSLQINEPLQRVLVRSTTGLFQQRVYSTCTRYGAVHIRKLQRPKVLSSRSSWTHILSEALNAQRLCLICKLSSTLTGRIRSCNHSFKDASSTPADRFLGPEKPQGNYATVASGFLLAVLASLSLALCGPDVTIASGSTSAGAAPVLRYSARPEDVEVEALKRVAINAWTIVNDTYVDGTFNHQNWNSTLRKTLDEMSIADSEDEAYTKLQAMLATLEDPYTRIMPPKDFQSFQISKDGSVEGVGLLLGSDQRSGRLYVLSPIKGGPAARAGILSGDELVQIDGDAIKGMNGEEAASRLRGRVGTSVTLEIHREEFSTNEAEGVPLSAASEIKIQLLREKIMLSPVSWTILPLALPDGHASTTGYIHLASFSERAAEEMGKVIREMEQKNVSSYILDLRDNPGGLVRAGLEVAEIWLDSNETVVNTVDRDGNKESIRLGADSHPVTDDPLVVLLNGNSASASEIVAGALHDNGRALLLGQRSFGKGKIQSVNELKDGSGLFVTIAKYLSPSLHDIDKKGITPDMECSAVGALVVDDRRPAADTAALMSASSSLRLIDRPSPSDADRSTTTVTTTATTTTSSSTDHQVGKDPCILAAQQQLGVLLMSMS